MRPFYLAVTCLASLSLTSLAPHAQDQPQPSPDSAFLIRAAASYGIPKSDAKPWHLRVSFRLLDAHGNVADHGTFEELWQSTDVSKQIYASDSFSQTSWEFDHRLLLKGDREMPLPPLSQLRDALTEPMGVTSLALRLVTTSGKAKLATRLVEFDGDSIRCYDINPTVPLDPPGPLATACFDSAGKLRQSTLMFASQDRMIIRREIEFQDCAVPADFSIQRNGLDVLIVHVEKLEPLGQVSDVEFQPPADAAPPELQIFGAEIPSNSPLNLLLSPGPPAGAPVPNKVNVSAGVAASMCPSACLKSHPPIYPPIAKAARVSGTVVLQATIGKDGAVESLHVISGPALLQQAALDAVKTWRYRPYLLNGQPVEVETTVNVIFNLPEPPKSSEQR